MLVVIKLGNHSECKKIADRNRKNQKCFISFTKNLYKFTYKNYSSSCQHCNKDKCLILKWVTEKKSALQKIKVVDKLKTCCYIVVCFVLSLFPGSIYQCGRTFFFDKFDHVLLNYSKI